MSSASVTLEQHHDAAYLLVTWTGIVDGQAINTSFRAMQTYLDAAASPLPIVLDLSGCQRFSAPDALRGALFGPFRHPMLDEWLVIGADSLARNIGRVLSNVTRIHNIRWFFTHEQAYTFLAAKTGLDLAEAGEDTLTA